MRIHCFVQHNQVQVCIIDDQSPYFWLQGWLQLKHSVSSLKWVSVITANLYLLDQILMTLKNEEAAHIVKTDVNEQKKVGLKTQVYKTCDVQMKADLQELLYRVAFRSIA